MVCSSGIAGPGCRRCHLSLTSSEQGSCRVFASAVVALSEEGIAAIEMAERLRLELAEANLGFVGREMYPSFVVASTAGWSLRFGSGRPNHRRSGL